MKCERGRVKMEKDNQTMKSKDKKANEENVYEEDNILRSLLSPLKEIEVPEYIDKCILETCENILQAEKEKGK